MEIKVALVISPTWQKGILAVDLVATHTTPDGDEFSVTLYESTMTGQHPPDEMPIEKYVLQMLGDGYRAAWSEVHREMTVGQATLMELVIDHQKHLS